jgi:hypothetical protein
VLSAFIGNLSEEKVAGIIPFGMSSQDGEFISFLLAEVERVTGRSVRDVLYQFPEAKKSALNAAGAFCLYMQCDLFESGSPYKDLLSMCTEMELIQHAEDMIACGETLPLIELMRTGVVRLHQLTPRSKRLISAGIPWGDDCRGVLSDLAEYLY